MLFLLCDLCGQILYGCGWARCITIRQEHSVPRKLHRGWTQMDTDGKALLIRVYRRESVVQYLLLRFLAFSRKINPSSLP